MAYSIVSANDGIGDYIELTLTNSTETVLVDEKYYPLFSQFTWHMDDKGYAKSSTIYKISNESNHRRAIAMHRIVMELEGCDPKGFVVDHVNLDKLDNRALNLRVVTHSENARNKPTSQGYLNVYYTQSKKSGAIKWFTLKSIKRVTYAVRYFDTALEAAIAADRIVMKYDPIHSRTNFHKDNYIGDHFDSLEDLKLPFTLKDFTPLNNTSFTGKATKIYGNRGEARYTEDGNIEVPLTQGKYTIISPEDYEFVTANVWMCTCGYARRNGTRANGQKRKWIHLHREIMKRTGVELPDEIIVDHINGNPLDNRRENLRLATNSQNCRNKKAWDNKISQYKGVFKHKRANDGFQWAAVISLPGGINKFLGYYDDEAYAAVVHDLGQIEYGDAYARLNFAREDYEGLKLEDYINKFEPKYGARGLYWINHNKKWQAKIPHPDKSSGLRDLNLGFFKEKDDAIRELDMAQIKYKGWDKAETYFPKEYYVGVDLSEVGQKKKYKNKYGYYGVSKTKAGTWIAQYKRGNVGTRKTPEEACMLYDLHVLKVEGSTAKTNYPLSYYESNGLYNCEMV